MTGGAAATIYIAGHWVEATNVAEFPVSNPATGEVIGTASDGGAEETRAAIAAAHNALPTWSATTAYERSAHLARMHQLVIDASERLAELLTREQGKPLRAARAEVHYAADFLLWFAEEAKRVYGRTVPSSRRNHQFRVQYYPVGVVAAITPWNYPISMLTRKIAPALAAGCTVVLKPAEQTPLLAVELMRLVDRAGLPPGVVNLVTSASPAIIGEEFLSNPAVRKLTFTGSTVVGKMLARGAAEQLKRVSLELGGHAPFIVLSDANPRRAAVGAAMVKMLNSGQACISPNRIYVHSPVADEFLDELKTRVEGMRVGDGSDETVSVGPLIDAPAVERMERHVADAVSRGAQVLTGGQRMTGQRYAAGTFFAPTVLSGVTPEMLIYKEETFGPIAPVTIFDDESDVIAMANDTAYGLASYLYTQDLRKALTVSRQLRFGIVGINDINPTGASVPFGGRGESGWGREGALEGIHEYLETQLVGVSY